MSKKLNKLHKLIRKVDQEFPSKIALGCILIGFAQYPFLLIEYFFRSMNILGASAWHLTLQALIFLGFSIHYRRKFRELKEFQKKLPVGRWKDD